MTTQKGGREYDLSIVKKDGSEIGLMLDLDKNGNKNYQRYDDPTLSQQYYVGRADYANLPPEKQMALIQVSWAAGYGLEFFDNEDDKRYYQSLGLDARFKNNILCGPKTSSIAVSAYTNSITDGGLNNWTDANNLTSWTKSATGTWLAQEGTIKHGGTYSARVNGTATRYFYQDLAWDTKYRGTTVTIKGWMYTTAGGGAVITIGIDDGGGSTNSTPQSNTGVWEQFSVSHKVTTGASYLHIVCTYTYASGSLACYFDDITWFSPIADGYPKVFAEFNDNLYVGVTDILYKLNATGDGLTFVNAFGKVITDLTPFTDGNLYISLGSTASKYYWMDGATPPVFTPSTLADGYAEFMTNVAGVMYKAVLPRELKKTSDPTNAGTWSTAINVGSTYHDITDLISETDVCYIGKEDMPYYLDTSDNDIPLIPDVQSLLKSTSCKNMIPWHTKIYVPVGNSGLVEYDSGIVTWRSPSLYQTNLSTFAGQVQAVAADEEYIFAMLDNSTKLEILAGQLREVDNRIIWAWHPIQEITLGGCETAFVSSIYKKRLWIASSVAGENLYYVPLPTKYGDVTGDTDYQFQTGGTLVTSWRHGNLQADQKAYFNLTLTAEGCDADNYIGVEYQTYYTALTGTWTSLGNFTNSPSQTRYFSDVTGTMIRFRFTIVTASVSTTPKLVSYDCRGIWRPKRRKLIDCYVKVADNVITKNGTQGSESEKSMREAIEEAADKVWPNTIYDIDGTEKTVAMLATRKHNVKLIKDKNPEYVYELIMEEIPLK